MEKRKSKNIQEIVKSANSSLFGELDVLYKLQECIDDKRKFQITINGFSGNWSNINIRMQKGQVDWEHYTINKK